MMRRFELQSYLRAIEKYGATEMGAVPPIILAIVMSPFSRTRPFMKSIRNVMCGAAPLSKELQARLLEFLEPGVPFNQVWGMTETSCIATLFAYPEKDDTGSVGRLIPNLEAKLVSPLFMLFESAHLTNCNPDLLMMTVITFQPSEFAVRSVSEDRPSFLVISTTPKPTPRALIKMPFSRPVTLAGVTKRLVNGISLIGKKNLSRSADFRLPLLNLKLYCSHILRS